MSTHEPPVVPLAPGDTAATAYGDSNGVHVVSARSGDHAWHRVADLRVAGWDAADWTESHCVTGDARFMAVAFAPTTFVNDQRLQLGGAVAAVIELDTGRRWMVPERVALTYRSPGCGQSLVTFVRRTGLDGAQTRLVTVDPVRSRVTSRIDSTADLGSPVPLADGRVLAAAGNSVVEASPSGSLRTRATAPGLVFDLSLSGTSVEYLVQDSPTTSTVYRLTGSKAVAQGRGRLHNLHIFGGRNGRNLLVGSVGATAGQDTVIAVPVTPKDVSVDGSLVIDQVSATSGIVSRPASGGASTNSPVTSDGADIADFAPLASTTTAATVATAPTCSVPMLDPTVQVVQPSPKQLEWAANRAVRGELTIARPANWQKHGLASYVPQSVFPRVGLNGWPNAHVPVQVLLGVMAQESNFNQASWHALAGVPGNPLIADYYGTVYDANGRIAGMDYANADCGYGVAQITTHMRASDATWSATKKLQVATDYQVNVAASVSFLENIWNDLQAAGIKINDGNPGKIENWYAALWAYNTGIQPNGTYNATGCKPGPTCTYNGYWGLGWTNNPRQSGYDPTRLPFLSGTYDDAKYPYKWPYQERVLGWAQNAQQDFVAGGDKYRDAGTLQNLTNYSLFCSASNGCSSTSTSTGYCLSTDRTSCWWHSPAGWTGSGTFEDSSSYVAGQAEPTVANPYPPACGAAAAPVVGRPGLTALPAGAVVIDELASSATNLAGCATTTSQGTFALAYGTDTSGQPTAKIDTHQVGVGYQGHIYFAHSASSSRPSMAVTGTWTVPTTTVGWQHLWVFVPANGATTHQADYKIWTGAKSYHRVVNQRWRQNAWVDLGIFQLSSGATVQLSNVTYSDFADGVVDVAWDAIALTPAAKPIASYVAFGDSYQAGEGDEPYDADADAPATNTPSASLPGAVQDERSHKNACHRSASAYPPLVFKRMMGVAGRTSSNTAFHFAACSGAVMDNVIGGTTHFGEAPQLDQGWLDENTTRVTIGIGGNDARFADILKGCVATLQSCTAPTYKLTINGVVDPEPLVTYEPKVISNLAPTLNSVLAKIHTLAPNAQITVVGYPYVVVKAADVYTPTCSLVFTPENLTWFRTTGDQLTAVMKNAAAANGASFLDLMPIYAGHEACSFDEWVNSTIAHSDTGSGSNWPGSGSFHPKAYGHSVVATKFPTTFVG
ncbi:hypothetical protein GCM10009721_42710 [Terrabacter tumescens]|uniref:SGNH hydrolase-type esterase domain-containing protein n=1 Tax=Terrabacter tumescens TaxID=60443 RepID=A0ABQ2IJC0_9MICO|nr:hypothetical protein GCM10009721_42710 [Terrabacter tumescens]